MAGAERMGREKKRKKNAAKSRACMVVSIPRKKMWCAYKSVNITQTRGIRLAAGLMHFTICLCCTRLSSPSSELSVCCIRWPAGRCVCVCAHLSLFMHFVCVSLCTHKCWTAVLGQNEKAFGEYLKRKRLKILFMLVWLLCVSVCVCESFFSSH